MAVDFGLALVHGPPKGQPQQWLADVDVAVAALQDHFRSLWMVDHFFWQPDMPTFEVWSVLSFLAARFPTHDVGPMVLGQSYRNPALTALMAATLQTLTNGRFIMSIGAGWKEDEYRAYNYDFPRAGIRIEQLKDTLNIFKKMWTEPGQVNYEGKHYKVVDAWCEPKPDPMIPIIVGGGGKKTMRLAAQYADMWNLFHTNLEYYTERLDILKQHCDDLDRDISTLRLTWFGHIAIGKTRAEAEKLRKPNADNHAFIGTPEQVAEEIATFVETGVDYFMVRIDGLPNPDVIGLITEELMPKVKSL